MCARFCTRGAVRRWRKSSDNENKTPGIGLSGEKLKVDGRKRSIDGMERRGGGGGGLVKMSERVRIGGRNVGSNVEMWINAG